MNVLVGNTSINSIKSFLKIKNIKTIFVISGKLSFKKSGADKKIKLLGNNFKIIYYNKLSSQPNYRDALNGAKIYIREKCECIISIGGGSAIDMGKLINVFQSHQGIEREITLGQKNMLNSLDPFIAIPTTAGSGSESTHFAVIYYCNRKYSIANKNMIPNLAIVDYSLTNYLSRYQTACTGMDALSQSIESYWSMSSTSKSRKYAKRAIFLIIENLADSVNKPSRLRRKNMMFASHLSGKAINITKTTAPHALSYKISQILKIPHGHAVAITLGYFFELNHFSNVVRYPNNKTKLRNTMKNIYKLFSENSPEKTKMRWFELMKNIGLEININKIYSKNNNGKTLQMRQIRNIVNSVNIERLENHPISISNSELLKVLKQAQLKS